MKPTAVFVATTGGPVRITRITRERAPQSMVCLKRSSTVLPISAAYDGFVRLGSGVVEKFFGPFEDGAFRLDVSDVIDGGQSWQLGVLVAHALVAAGHMLASEAEAERFVWLTGEVDCDLAVGSVGHVTEKIRAARGALAAWRVAGREVVLIVPEGADHQDALLAGLPDGVRLIAARSAVEALELLDIDLPENAPLPRHKVPALRPEPKVPTRWLASGLAAASVAAVAVGMWPTPNPVGIPAPAVESAKIAPASPASTPTRVAPAPLPASPAFAPPVSSMQLVERRAPAGHSCADVQFGAVAAVETTITAGVASPLDGLCGLGVAVDNGASADYVAVSLDVLSGKLLYGTTKPTAFSGLKPFTGRHEWAVDLPRRMSQPFEIRVIAVSGPRAAAEEAHWFAAQGAGPAATKALEEKGFAAATLQHRVLP